MRHLLSVAKDLLFPKFCTGCKKEGDWVCESCLSVPTIVQEDDKVAYPLDGVAALFDYGENTSSDLIKMFKYNYLLELAEIFEKMIKNISFNNTWPDFIILSVPLHARRERERGFNQAEILAKMFAKKLGLVMGSGLFRSVYTKQQARLSAEERQNNLKDVFIFNGEAPNKILLVDDVYTTGATMRECARVLKDKGAKVVWGLVLARG